MVSVEYISPEVNSESALMLFLNPDRSTLGKGSVRQRNKQGWGNRS